MTAESLKLVRMKRAVNALMTDINTKIFPVERIILFGSIVDGVFNEHSDLDLCVVAESDLSDQEKRDIENAIRHILQDELEIDIVYCNRDKLQNGQHVFKSIQENGRILYEKQ